MSNLYHILTWDQNVVEWFQSRNMEVPDIEDKISRYPTVNEIRNVVETYNEKEVDFFQGTEHLYIQISDPANPQKWRLGFSSSHGLFW